jgi:hypothetical protein
MTPGSFVPNSLFENRFFTGAGTEAARSTKLHEPATGMFSAGSVSSAPMRLVHYPPSPHRQCRCRRKALVVMISQENGPLETGSLFIKKSEDIFLL